MRHLAILDKDGNYLSAGYFEEGNEPEFCTDILPTIPVEFAQFNGTNWIDNSPPIQLTDAEKYELLKVTDWYVVRMAETGTPIPNEILIERQRIRNS